MYVGHLDLLPTFIGLMPPLAGTLNVPRTQPTVMPVQAATPRTRSPKRDYALPNQPSKVPHFAGDGALIIPSALSVVCDLIGADNALAR